mgnify:CR=1 FL=1
MNNDKKIKVGLAVFLCSITAITLIKGTYAYPNTMANDGDSGRIVPLGGDEVCLQCGNSYHYGQIGTEGCTVVDYSFCMASPTPTKPSPSPSVSPSVKPSISPSKKPTIPSAEPQVPACYLCTTDQTKYYWGTNPPMSSEVCSGPWVDTGLPYSQCGYVEPSPSPSPSPIQEDGCYVCSTDSNNYYWGLKPDNGSNSCSGYWYNTNKTQNACKPENVPDNPNTGSFLLYVAYVVGFGALLYSGLNFYRYRKQNNK